MEISPIEYARAKNMLGQVKRTTQLVNTTSNPEVYFGRLNYVFDMLLTLKRYEKYGIFTDFIPSREYDILLENLEKSVNDFIDRSFCSQEKKAEKLKTDKAKSNNMNRFIEKIRLSFKNSNTFWSGNIGEEHYTGRLYTKGNIEYLDKKIKSCKYINNQ